MGLIFQAVEAGVKPLRPPCVICVACVLWLVLKVKQLNGSDCRVLGIAYAFDICSGFDPCQVRFDHRTIR